LIKNLILISITSTLVFAANYKNKAKSIVVRGIVTDIKAISKYKKVRVTLDNGEKIKATVYRTARINRYDRVLGRCSNLEYGEYQNCSLTKIKDQ